MRVVLIAGLVAGAIAAASCTPARKTGETSALKKQSFGKTAAGQQVDLYTLSNRNGMEAAIMNYGGVVVSLKVPDRNGKFDDVALGFDTLDGYLRPNPYFGALVGRYGNRIAKGKFTLDGVEYTLARNNGENALHGGLQGFDKRVWTARDVSSCRYAAPGIDLREQGRRGGLSRHPDGGSDLLAHRRERTAHRLFRHHRQGHRPQPDQPLLLQPGRAGQRAIF